MSAGFALRRLGPDDAAAFREVRLEGLGRHPDCFGASAEIEGARPLGFFVERLESHWVLGGFSGEILAGIAGLHVPEGAKERHKGVLWGMYVRAERRGGGLGRALVDGLLAHAAEVVETVTLTVTASNGEAMRLYFAAGFTVYGLEKDAFKIGDRYLDSVLMSRPV